MIFLLKEWSSNQIDSKCCDFYLGFNTLGKMSANLNEERS